MEKLKATSILVKGAKIKAVKLDENSQSVKQIIEETQLRQTSILKLKEVDQTRLKMVVQL